MNRIAFRFGFSSQFILICGFLSAPLMVAAQRDHYAEAFSMYYRDHRCDNRAGQFGHPARMPADLHKPEAALVIFSGKPVCIQLDHYQSSAEESGAVVPRALHKVWRSGFIGVADASCPLVIAGSEGTYHLIVHPPAIIKPPAGSPPPAASPGEKDLPRPPFPSARQPGLRCENIAAEEGEKIILLTASGEATVATYNTDDTPFHGDWRGNPEIEELIRADEKPGRLIPVPGGEFFMGCDMNFRECPSDDSPGHQIKLEHDFYLMDAEVSIGEYLMAQWSGYDLLPILRPLQVRSYGSETGIPLWLPLSYPATMVKWEEADHYCSNQGGRLPTEAEWEQAARLNQTEAERTQLPPAKHESAEARNRRLVAETENRKARVSRIRLPSPGPFIEPVRNARAGLLGLFDLSGNVSEWVEDWFDPKYYSERRYDNPEGEYLGRARIVRGDAAESVHGFLFQSPADFHAATDENVWRRFHSDGASAPDIGFRCAFDKNPGR
jgi:formylglycine-generating enzyme required for sulfatase activity